MLCLHVSGIVAQNFLPWIKSVTEILETISLQTKTLNLFHTGQLLTPLEKGYSFPFNEKYNSTSFHNEIILKNLGSKFSTQ